MDMSGSQFTVYSSPMPAFLLDLTNLIKILTVNEIHNLTHASKKARNNTDMKPHPNDLFTSQ